jgi:hypothetical protein
MFAHINVNLLHTYYRWIRVTGVGEIAYINGNAYRVFFQSQIYGLFGLLMLVPLLAARPVAHRRPWWFLLPIILGTTAVLISLSRSFWMGGIVALAFFLIFGFRQLRMSVKNILTACITGMLVFAASYTLMSWALNFPYPCPPQKGSHTAEMIGQRFTALSGEAAASSRMNELGPLRNGILKNPFLGSGFGQKLTYKSNDPRQLLTPMKGMYTTYAFEWGYLDFILKVGILGLLAYLGLLVVTLKTLWQQRSPLAIGFFLGIVSLLVIHFTTPYLNHPLGIGFLLLALPLVRNPIKTSSL